eukprot:5969716-Pyramimonas_sp.AAC.2
MRSKLSNRQQVQIRARQRLSCKGQATTIGTLQLLCVPGSIVRPWQQSRQAMQTWESYNRRHHPKQKQTRCSK